MNPNSGDTLVSVLRAHARSRGDQLAFTFVDKKGDETRRLTFAELDHNARAVAVALSEYVAPGDRVLLLFAPTLDFVVAFFGALYAGVVPVPAYPAIKPRDLERLGRVVESSGARCVLTHASVSGLSRALCAEAPIEALNSLHWLELEAIPASAAAAFSEPELRPDALAFLQYTSGSTGTPRGVMVTHGNLLHNQRMIQQAFRHDQSTTIVAGWLPLYHDMGLIGNVLQPLFLGRPCILMSPLDFLQRPALWLEIISRYRATTSGGPNFAYELCTRRVTPEQRDGLDLSTWRLAFNGAEPVRGDVLDAFARAFASHGFRKAAFYPCYGLAEATLFVTGGQAGTEPEVVHVDRAELTAGRISLREPTHEAARALVSCGHHWLDQELAIVDPVSTERAAPGSVGEIWLSGSSVAQGYWNEPQSTERTFQAALVGSTDRRFLRTGDLGFLRGDALFVTGRLKDVVIIRGRNHYAEDIELTVERATPWVRPGCGAAFAVESAGEERLLLVHEVTRDALKAADLTVVADDIREAVTGHHGVRPHEIVLVMPGSMPKTSSGKVRRHLCRQHFLANALEVARSRHHAREARGLAASSPGSSA